MRSPVRRTSGRGTGVAEGKAVGVCVGAVVAVGSSAIGVGVLVGSWGYTRSGVGDVPPAQAATRRTKHVKRSLRIIMLFSTPRIIPRGSQKTKQGFFQKKTRKLNAIEAGLSAFRKCPLSRARLNGPPCHHSGLCWAQRLRGTSGTWMKYVGETSKAHHHFQSSSPFTLVDRADESAWPCIRVLGATKAFLGFDGEHS